MTGFYLFIMQQLLCDSMAFPEQRDLREENIFAELSFSVLQQPSYPSPPLSSSAKYEHQNLEMIPWI